MRSEEIRQQETQENERATGNHTSSKRDIDALMYCDRYVTEIDKYMEAQQHLK